MVTTDNPQRVAAAMEHLRQARELLKRAGATRTVERVRLAITSAGGALRHAQGKEARPLPPGIERVTGHAGLQFINHEQRLYVVPCGDDGFSCWGFDVAERKGAAVAAWLGEPWPEIERGTVAHFDAFQSMLDKGRAHHAATGQRCPADLTPQLIGLEGKRVEVTAPDGTQERFIVGKSRGWLPCHLEIARRDSHGGPAVYLPEGATVRVVG